MVQKLKIKKGDRVVVISGKDLGKQGEVLRVIPSEFRVVVSGVNLLKSHVRPSQANAGGIVAREHSIHVSNIACVDPKTGKATRVGYKTLSDGKKVRFAKGSGEIIDNE